MPRVTPEAVKAEILRRLQAGESQRSISADLRVSHTTIRRLERDMTPTAGSSFPRRSRPSAASRSRQDSPQDPPTPTEDGPALGLSRLVESGDAATADLVSDRIIRTEAEALAYGEIDTAVWKVDRIETTAWPVAMKVAQGKGLPDRVVTKQLWRIHLKLSRIFPQPFLDAGNALFERFRSHRPEFKRPPSPARHAPRPCLVEIDLYDVHFGKLAWSRETGQDQDLRIIETLYSNGVDDLLDEVKGRTIEEFVFTIGQDFFHVDGPKNETTNGTRQDADGRYAKIVEVGEMAVIRAIDRMLQVAPVRALYVPGNHDRVSSLHLSRTIAAWYRNSRDVTVDCEPTTRKYVRYGVSLLGYVHGDETKDSALPGIMADARPRDWGETTCRQWRCGHLHTRSLSMTPRMNTHSGCEVWRLSSLSAADAWHYGKGYVANRRAAECFIIDKQHGFKGHFVADARL